jgi:hypothetical protein
VPRNFISRLVFGWKKSRKIWFAFSSVEFSRAWHGGCMAVILGTHSPAHVEGAENGLKTEELL